MLAPIGHALGAVLTSRRAPSPSNVASHGRAWPERIVGRMRRDVLLATLDSCVVLAAYLAPLVLRFDGVVPERFWRNFWGFMPLAVAIHLTANLAFGLYGRMWRYASVDEARRVALAAITAGTIVLTIDVLTTPRSLPVSVVAPGAVLALLAFGAIRFQSRLFGFRRRTASLETRRVLLVGAGDAGALVLKDIINNPSLALEPVGVLDDDGRKAGRSLHGVRILGTRAQLPSIVVRLDVDEVLLAIPSATGDLVREVAALCEEASVSLKVLPSVREIVGGRITARDIRDLRIEDLLGREQVVTDLDSVREVLRGRRVLVTGGGGSIGSEIARQVSTFDPSELVLLDHDETHLHDTLLGLTEATAKGVLADVRARGKVIEIFATWQPEVVFHAAAHKHVPLLEEFPEEAVLTNVIGTANVVDAALVAGVRRFVLISTDKAVRPASVMGSTKWFAEQIVRSVQGRDCVFCAVRFGNVLGSRGSVIPTFLDQIGKGGPVTVTDPAMERYFMSTQEAVELVLQASALSEGGEVLTLEMGLRVNILDLARRLIRLSGRVPQRDVTIEVVGARPGEKLIEDLVDPEEQPVPSGYPGISVSWPPVPDRPTLRLALRELETLVNEGRTEELAQRLKELAAGAHARIMAGELR